MMSLEKARSFLKNKDISDEELSEIVNNLYGIAESVIDNYIETKKNEQKKQNKALIKNAIIPGLDIAVAGSLNPIAIGVWYAVKNLYGLYADLSKSEIEGFIEEINDRLKSLNKKISKQDKEFQQGLLIQIEEIIRTRNTYKKEVLKKIFIDGFLESDNKESFELEKFNNTLRLLSLDDIKFLCEFNSFPLKMAHISTEEDVLGKTKDDYTKVEELNFLSGIGILRERIKISKGILKSDVGIFSQKDGIVYEFSSFGNKFIDYLVG